jgi:hypothetical protein
MNRGLRIVQVVLAVVLAVSLTDCAGKNGSNGQGGIADYSGTYFVTLGPQPRWMMSIDQSGQNVSFTLDGQFQAAGEGTAGDNTISLTADINGTLNIALMFSGDGESFSGNWNFMDGSGAILQDGTITGNKGPRVTYDVDANGIPQFASTDVIELLKISELSKFRSGAGHDYSDDFESCRSMKHYFTPQSTVDKLSVMIFSPINGTVIGTMHERAEDLTSKGIMVGIQSDDYPAFHFIIFHIDLIKDLNVGDKIAAGQLLGYPPDYDNVTIADTAVGVNTPGGYKLISYFDVMTDSLFRDYALRGLNSREDAIITKDERDADPLTCDGETFADGGNLENWVVLN